MRAAKAVLREKFRVINVYVRKIERSKKKKVNPNFAPQRTGKGRTN